MQLSSFTTYPCILVLKVFWEVNMVLYKPVKGDILCKSDYYFLFPAPFLHRCLQEAVCS